MCQACGRIVGRRAAAAAAAGGAVGVFPDVTAVLLVLERGEKKEILL